MLDSLSSSFTSISFLTNANNKKKATCSTKHRSPLGYHYRWSHVFHVTFITI